MHPEFLAGEKVPRKLVTKHIWKERCEDINAFERYMSRNGYVIWKFFLNVSKKEQKRRFLERLTMPEIGAAVISALRGLDLRFPVVDKAKMKELDAARIALEGKSGNRPGSVQKKEAA